MISNDAELAIVREQIGRLESALKSLQDSIGPKGERQFRLIAEGYLEQIVALRSGVDRYLARTAPASMAAASAEGAGGPANVFRPRHAEAGTRKETA